MYLSRFKIISTISSIIFLVGLQPSQAQQQNVDSLLAVLQTTKADTSKVKLLYKISDAHFPAKADEAKDYALQGLALSKKIAFKEGQGICLKALGKAYYILEKYDSAMTCFEKQYEIAKELKDSVGIASVYLNKGAIFAAYGNEKKALEFYKKAKEISASKNTKTLLTKAYINIGDMYEKLTEYPMALEYYLKACEIGEEKELEKSLLLVNIGSIYFSLKQYEKAKQYAFEAKVKYEKANNCDGVGGALNMLANVYFINGDFENAVKFYKEAKSVFEKAQSLHYEIMVDSNLGQAYSKLGEQEKALNCFFSALLIAKKIEEPRIISSLYASIGETYRNKGDFLKALEYMRKAEKTCLGQNHKTLLLELFNNFIDIYNQLNQPDSVSRYFKRYQQLSDTIFNEQTTKSIAEMQTKYETEKKDKEILALNLETQKKKNAIWAIASGAVLLLVVLLSGFVVFRNKKKREQAVLSLMARESDMNALRSQMNPHFIFNCIHTINGLLNELKIQESKTCLDKFLRT